MKVVIGISGSFFLFFEGAGVLGSNSEGNLCTEQYHIKTKKHAREVALAWGNHVQASLD